MLMDTFSGSLLPSVNSLVRSCVFALALTLAIFGGPEETAAASDDGPARFDLAVDFRGKWLFESMEGCEAYMEITGTRHFPSGKMTCTMLPNTKMQQIIWQDCLEMTISGSSSGMTKSPLHHMILNGEYLTDDWSAAGSPAQWTSQIVPAGPRDVDAASPVVVFHIEGDLDANARRYIDTAGRLVQSWTATAERGNKTATFLLKFQKEEELPCNGYDPEACAGRTYDDGVGATGWTPSCCLDSYGDHQDNPNKRECASELSTTTTTATATDAPQAASASTADAATSSVCSRDSGMLTIATILAALW